MNFKPIKNVVIGTLVSLVMMNAQASPANQCKGLESAACKGNTACGWVDSYQRKDGRKVNGFCRTSSKGKARKAVKRKAKSD